ncbi:hypothetical protein GCM10009764_35300 [Nocardia ninae]|uniref:Uncharacterized protein n=1 Tax=Nocardia ninae NBRC 108245 TaxID=1210091 RepID=A0A511MFU5_9NOCA|nr:hypothetical protein NN4_40920 [Nocardia ninae NBRC 108245]
MACGLAPQAIRRVADRAHRRGVVGGGVVCVGRVGLVVTVGVRDGLGVVDMVVEVGRQVTGGRVVERVDSIDCFVVDLVVVGEVRGGLVVADAELVGR